MKQFNKTKVKLDLDRCNLNFGTGRFDGVTGFFVFS